MLPDISEMDFTITLHPDLTIPTPPKDPSYAYFLHIKEMSPSGAFEAEMRYSDPASQTKTPVKGTLSESRPGGYAITFTVTVTEDDGLQLKTISTIYKGGLILADTTPEGIDWQAFMAGTMSFSGSSVLPPATDVPFCALGTPRLPP